MYFQTSEHDDIWDDSLLIKAYEESIKIQKEEIAKKIAMKTNKKSKSEKSEEQTESSVTVSNDEQPFKVGDYVRCTYEDGIDYEAEILTINENGTSLIRYIGYGNEQRVKVDELVASWGIEAREEQKLLAEADNPTEENREHQEELHSFIMNKSSGVHSKLPVPPMVSLFFMKFINKIHNLIIFCFRSHHYPQECLIAQETLNICLQC